MKGQLRRIWQARWCELIHRGEVHYWNGTPVWTCDTCGRVVDGVRS